MILYRGLSDLDHVSPIMVVATRHSQNAKTGPMTQLWILRSDVHPFHAVRTGQDAAVCGDCVLRGTGDGDRQCYVNVQHAPAAIYRAVQAGRYRDLSGSAIRVQHYLAGEAVRLGAYGDPAAVPFDWWPYILRRTSGWTGYTSQWRTCDMRFREWCMASVKSEREHHQAKAEGWRTYRVCTPDSRPLNREVRCPASDEMAHRTTCQKCLLCNGSGPGDRRASIVIHVHGPESAFWSSRQPTLWEAE